MATSSRTGQPEISDISAVAMVIPALGPSLGIAPAGTCRCRSCLANQSSGSSGASSAAWERTCDSAAWADSRITSPSWPVRISWPEPGIAVASTNRTSPPAGVQASPVATPGWLVRRRVSEKNRRLPSSSRARFSEIVTRRVSFPSAACRAILRQTVPISRSRLRTPASRV